MMTSEAVTLPVNSNSQVISNSTESYSSYTTLTRTHNTVRIATISLTYSAGGVSTSLQTQSYQTTNVLTYPVNSAGHIVSTDSYSSFTTSTRTHNTVIVSTVQFTNSAGESTSSLTTMNVPTTQVATYPVNQYGEVVNTESYSSFTTSTRTHNTVIVSTVQFTNSVGEITSSPTTLTVPTTEAVTYPVNQLGEIVSTESYSLFTSSTRTHNTVIVSTVQFTNSAGEVTSSPTTLTVPTTEAVTYPINSVGSVVITGYEFTESYSSFTTFTRTHNTVIVSTVQSTNSAGKITSSPTTLTIPTSETVSYPINSVGSVISTTAITSASYSSFTTLFRTHNTVTVATIIITNSAGEVTTSPVTQTVPTSEAVTYPVNSADSVITTQGTVTESGETEYSSFTTFFRTHNTVVYATISTTNSAGEVATTPITQTVPTTEAVTFPINSVGSVVTTGKVITHENTYSQTGHFGTYSSFSTLFRTHNTVVFATVRTTNSAGEFTTTALTQTVPTTEAITYAVNSFGSVVTTQGTFTESGETQYSSFTTFFQTHNIVTIATISTTNAAGNIFTTPVTHTFPTSEVVTYPVNSVGSIITTRTVLTVENTASFTDKLESFSSFTTFLQSHNTIVVATVSTTNAAGKFTVTPVTHTFPTTEAVTFPVNSAGHMVTTRSMATQQNTFTAAEFESYSSFTTFFKTYNSIVYATVGITNAAGKVTTSPTTYTVPTTQAVTYPINSAGQVVTTTEVATHQNTFTTAAAFESYSSFTTFFKTYNSFIFATVSITNAAGKVTTSATTHTVPITEAVTYPINTAGEVVTYSSHAAYSNFVTIAAGTTSTERPVQVETVTPQGTPTTKVVTQRTSVVFYTDTFVTSYSTVTIGKGGITHFLTADTLTVTSSSKIVYGTTTTQAVHVTVTPSGYSAKAGVGATTTTKNVSTTPLVSNAYVDVYATQYVTSYVSATTDSLGHVSYVYLEYTGSAETAAETSSASGFSNASSNSSSNSSNNSFKNTSGNTSNSSSNNSSGNSSNNSSGATSNNASNNSSGNTSNNSSGNTSNNSSGNTSNNSSGDASNGSSNNSSGNSSNNSSNSSSGSSNSSNSSSGSFNSSNSSSGSSESSGSSNSSNNASSNSSDSSNGYSDSSNNASGNRSSNLSGSSNSVVESSAAGSSQSNTGSSWNSSGSSDGSSSYAGSSENSNSGSSAKSNSGSSANSNGGSSANSGAKSGSAHNNANEGSSNSFVYETTHAIYGQFATIDAEGHTSYVYTQISTSVSLVTIETAAADPKIVTVDVENASTQYVYATATATANAHAAATASAGQRKVVPTAAIESDSTSSNDFIDHTTVTTVLIASGSPVVDADSINDNRAVKRDFVNVSEAGASKITIAFGLGFLSFLAMLL
ncbi:unnamed protein product [Ambrosiozyma monospora]|uniref:Unnamed protein product n=1 Tax=Ambrosiozyma monospora TaxID=43982 RepID=A0A9W6WHG3_AMBMO|nr:unnamed protein product [Ambrosiozyma monospora]